MEEQSPVEPKNKRMFEADRELLLPATPSFMPNNLSLVYFEPKFTTYACYCSKNLVQLITWDLQMENVTISTLIPSFVDNFFPPDQKKAVCKLAVFRPDQGGEKAIAHFRKHWVRKSAGFR